MLQWLWIRWRVECGEKRREKTTKTWCSSVIGFEFDICFLVVHSLYNISQRFRLCMCEKWSKIIWGINMKHIFSVREVDSYHKSIFRISFCFCCFLFFQTNEHGEIGNGFVCLSYIVKLGRKIARDENIIVQHQVDSWLTFNLASFFLSFSTGEKSFILIFLHSPLCFSIYLSRYQEEWEIRKVWFWVCKVRWQKTHFTHQIPQYFSRRSPENQ